MRSAWFVVHLSPVLDNIVCKWPHLSRMLMINLMHKQSKHLAIGVILLPPANEVAGR